MSLQREILYRKNQRKLYQESYLEKIRSFFELNPDELTFLSLEESDQIKAEILGKKRNGSLLDLEEKDLSQALDLLKSHEGSYYVFIDEDWKYCGAFLLRDLGLVRQNAVFGKVRDQVVFISQGYDRRIELEYSDQLVEYTDFHLS